MLGSSSLKWAQTKLCRPSGYGVYWLFVPYSRVLRYRCVKPSELMAEGYTERSLPPWKLEWYWTSVCCHTCFLCILHVINVRKNIIGQLSKKKQYITPLPHPLLSLKSVFPCYTLTTGGNVLSTYSNCISYNFFIFCPICMKFSHNILHTCSIYVLKYVYWMCIHIQCVHSNDSFVSPANFCNDCVWNTSKLYHNNFLDQFY